MGRKRAANLRNGDNAVHALEAVKVRDDLPLLCVEHNQVVGVHVCGVKAAVLSVEGLVVKANGRPGQGDLRNLLQHRASRLVFAVLTTRQVRIYENRQTCNRADLSHIAAKHIHRDTLPSGDVHF